MKQIIKKIKQSKRVGIIAHISPDEDCLGSMSALCLALRGMNKHVQMFVDTKKKAEEFRLFNFNEEISGDLDAENFDLVIAVDVASKRLLGKYGPVFDLHNNTICIDHHESRDLEAKINYVEPYRASCSEIIFDLLTKLKVKITKDIASCLFAGVVGDTGCFEHDNVQEETHITASKLYGLGADTKRIIYYYKKYQTKADIKLKKMVYANMFNENKVAYMIFTNKIIKEAGTDNTKRYVNEMLNIEDNIFAFGINQNEKNTYSVSIRCKEGYNACEIASKYGGGGHSMAAGFAFVGAPVKHAKMLYEDCLNQIKQKEQKN